MPTATAFLITRDPSLTKTVQEVVQEVNHLHLQSFPSFETARTELSRADAALVLCHLIEEGDWDAMAGLLRHLALHQRSLPTLGIGEHYVARDALRVLSLGAADYLPRPLDLRRLSYLLDVLSVRARYEPRPTPPAGNPSGIESLGADGTFLYSPTASMGRLIDQVRQVAPQDMNILIGGETGTGKSHLARIIHELSPRKQQPFMVINCGALSPNVIESEMFGHVRGAFTGADRDRTGKFADVGRGTILLDDIETLPIELQARLLRVVEERVFEPMGSNKSIPMLGRLIVASNRNLEQEVAGGRFRPDLYYRLNVVAFFLPPLREQLSVVPAIVDRFVREFSHRGGRPVTGIASRALQTLQEYGWPGNIRELRNVIERAVALCPGDRIMPEDLPDSLREPSRVVQTHAPTAVLSGPTVRFHEGLLSRTKETAEAMRISEALARNNNNRLKAAAELGISRMTLYKKLHRYGLMEPVAGNGYQQAHQV